MLKMVFVLGVFVLTGCAAQLTSGNARSVTVSARTQDTASAQKIADVECAKHSRIAKFITRTGPTLNEVIFDCVN